MTSSFDLQVHSQSPRYCQFYRDYLRCELYIEKYSWLFAVMTIYESDSVLVHGLE